MTKYKKLTRSSFVIVALCLALVGILAFGGTYAYFTDTATTTAATKTGILGFSAPASITITEQSWVPNQTISLSDVTLTYDEGSNVVGAMRVTVKVSGTKGCDLITMGTLDGYYEDTAAATNAAASMSKVFYANKTFIGGGSNSIDTLSGINFTLSKDAGNEYQNLSFSIEITIDYIQAEYASSSTEATYTDGGSLASLDAAKAIFEAVGAISAKA